ncbi:MAG: type I methionyl aminopeptidase [Syntrophorhabdaceae bacterium]|nr:type I methionyl aminopeptidase [Syntrophorhabdaceae bacterium]
MIRPGVTTGELEEFADDYIRRCGVKSAFKGYMGYPAHLCASLNEGVVHGIPSRKRVVQNGDILSIDFGVFKDGYYGDAAKTFAVGEIDPKSARLIEVTEKSLYAGIEAAKPGKRVGDISSAVQTLVEAAGFSVVRDFVGHGIGKSMHEEPQVPNFGCGGTGPVLYPGMTIAIEPMVNAGGYEVRVMSDGWTVLTRDGSRSAHFEHTIVVTEYGNEILSVV